ncbi:MAG: NUDIX domain-containing protein [Chloroflexi bacterium]|nr:NUDIX domain-containing protein [Chloroflexota bacterium]
MSQVIYGERLGREGKIRVGCSATIFDAAHEKVLLTQRADNGRWCLPGGGLDPGESVEEACIREVWEETGLHVRITRLIGVYSDPNQLVIYNDGNKAFFVVMSFEAEIIGGELGLSDETTAFGYFSLAEMDSMPMHNRHQQRVVDALLNQPEALIK